MLIEFNTKSFRLSMRILSVGFQTVDKIRSIMTQNAEHGSSAPKKFFKA